VRIFFLSSRSRKEVGNPDLKLGKRARSSCGAPSGALISPDRGRISIRSNSLSDFVLPPLGLKVYESTASLNGKCRKRQGPQKSPGRQVWGQHGSSLPGTLRRRTGPPRHKDTASPMEDLEVRRRAFG
jgi:hypothetical protein